MSDPELLSQKIVDHCLKFDLHLAVAESITGGALSSALVSVPGASRVLLGSIVAYQSELKHSLLGVTQKLLATRGPVDSQVALQMAKGVRNLLAADCPVDPAKVIGISTTGVAGPEPQGNKPVGLVFVAIAGDAAGLGNHVFELNLVGDRNQIRTQAVETALQKLWEQFVI